MFCRKGKTSSHSTRVSLDQFSVTEQTKTRTRKLTVSHLDPLIVKRSLDFRIYVNLPELSLYKVLDCSGDV